jgi:decaprenylphospho-beta-D-ribofuranose 2-oxidase
VLPPVTLSRWFVLFVLGVRAAADFAAAAPATTMEPVAAETMLDGPPPVPARTRVSGWGGGPGVCVQLLEPDRPERLVEAVQAARTADRGALGRGMGRSYGDAAQLEGGLVVQTTRLREFELDPGQGVVTAQAGVTLGRLLRTLVPAGWIVPVLPGTQHVSVGGAIASDIHGKNHGVAGTFANHVERLGLLTSTGEVLELEPGAPDRRFEATVGGMGLTGLIVWARIRLQPVASSLMSVDTDRVADLDDAFAALQAPGGAYRVAWIDVLSSPAGRGAVTRADPLPSSGQPPTSVGATVNARATVPAHWPRWPLRPATVRTFNELRFRRTPRRERGRPEPIGSHLFPLDVLDAWPRLYGPDGFLQYQLAVPFGAEDVLRKVIDQLHRTRIPCYLAVLKDFGAASEAPLSFPIPGWTLTLDIPRRAPGLVRVLDGFDELVAGAGGRVYLSKDVRMSRAALAAMYPRLDEWRELRDELDPHRLWRSDLGLRTGLVGPGSA